MDEEFKPIESQEAFDAAIKARIEREREKYRAKYADYADLKAKATAWDEAKDAEKSELERANAEIERLKADAEKRDAADARRALKEKVSKATGVPADLIAGDDEDAMTSFAEAVKGYAKKPSAPKVDGAGRFAEGPRADSDKARFAAALFGKE